VKTLSELGSDERFRLLVQSITDYAIFMLDPDGTVVSWNAGAQRFKGYAADEIIGQSFARFYPEADRAAGLPERALRIAAKEGRFESEGWRLRQDGTRFWAHVVLDPIQAEDGTLIGFAKITRDLTERQAAQQALRQSEERFRLLVQNVTDYAIFMLDPEGRVANWNLGAQRIKGYLPDEIIGEHFSRFYTEEDRAAGLPRVGLETAAREGRFEKEGWRVRKDGSRFLANVVIDAIRDDDGQLLGFAKITRDVTERAEAQRSLEKAREAFFQSQKLEAIGKLTGGVAHDFNNLLAAVIGGLSLIERRASLDAKQQKILSMTRHAAEQGTELVGRLLAFARRQQLQPANVSIEAMEGSVTGLLAHTLGGLVELKWRVPPNIWNAFADPAQLELALMNLIINARDSMAEGGTVIVSAENRAVQNGNENDLRPGHYVVLTVADTGCGIPAEMIEEVLQPFVTTKEIGKGTGLGLSMVYGFAQQSNGAFRLSSKVGKGTQAEIWLPRAADQGTVRKPPPPPAEIGDTQPLNILIVDDHHEVRIATAGMLEELGHSVRQAPRGRDALTQLDGDNRCDLLITDYAMPNMSGTELVREARKRKPGLRSMIITGYADNEALAGSLEDVAILSKPFSLEKLAQAIGAVVASAGR
jgi:PAS domain S-box-containing protein